MKKGIHSGWISAVLSVALFIALDSVGRSAPSDTVAVSNENDSYVAAVNQYVRAAEQEVKGLKNRVLAKKDNSNQKGFHEANLLLEKCEALVAKLKVTTPRGFDGVKAAYEQTRASLLSELSELK
jgi:hypothetical protein